MRPVLCFLLFAAFLLPAQMLFGQSPDSTHNLLNNPIIVTDGDSVKNYIDKVISIEGKIANATEKAEKGGIAIYLDMFEAWPKNPFSIKIYPENVPNFEDYKKYDGKKVRIIGRVSSFKDKKFDVVRFLIPLRKPNQIIILD